MELGRVPETGVGGSSQVRPGLPAAAAAGFLTTGGQAQGFHDIEAGGGLGGERAALRPSQRILQAIVDPEGMVNECRDRAYRAAMGFDIIVIIFGVAIFAAAFFHIDVIAALLYASGLSMALEGGKSIFITRQCIQLGGYDRQIRRMTQQVDQLGHHVDAFAQENQVFREEVGLLTHEREAFAHENQLFREQVGHFAGQNERLARNVTAMEALLHEANVGRDVQAALIEKQRLLMDRKEAVAKQQEENNIQQRQLLREQARILGDMELLEQKQEELVGELAKESEKHKKALRRAAFYSGVLKAVKIERDAIKTRNELQEDRLILAKIEQIDKGLLERARARVREEMPPLQVAAEILSAPNLGGAALLQPAARGGAPQLVTGVATTLPVARGATILPVAGGASTLPVARGAAILPVARGANIQSFDRGAAVPPALRGGADQHLARGGAPQRPPISRQGGGAFNEWSA